MEHMSMTLRTATLFIALGFSAATIAAPRGDVAAGKAKAQQVCAACHGADGNKTLDSTYPKLAGQYADYLSKALHDYKSGKRSNAIMVGQAQAPERQGNRRPVGLLRLARSAHPRPERARALSERPESSAGDVRRLAGGVVGGIANRGDFRECAPSRSSRCPASG